MAKLYLLGGIQGSGKTTYSRMNKDRLDAHVISTDYIRKNFQPIEEKDVFPTAYRLTAEYLNKGENVIFDATNINRDVRSQNVMEIKKLLNTDIEIICLFLNTNVELCKSRVEVRNTKDGEIFIPLDVIDNYSQKVEMPSDDEGFDEIIIIDNYLVY